MELTDLEISKDEFYDDAVTYTMETPVGVPIVFYAKNIRTEHTGIHAELGIKFDESDTYTVCNIKRGEEQTKLTNKAYKFFGPTKEAADAVCSKEELINRFAQYCKLVFPKAMEVQEPEEIIGSINTSSVSYIAKPHVLSKGGTIMYGKPGRGKSFTGMALAVAVQNGANHYWETEKVNSLFINLERPERTMAPRLGAVNQALGLNSESPLSIMNAKGYSLSAIRDVLISYIKKQEIGFVVVDSISRAGTGDMKEDIVATTTINLLNEMGVSWLGIAHTPKYDETVYYGNSQYEAGADVMVRHTSDIIDEKGSIAVALEVTKANDMPIPQPVGLHYSFNEYGLSAIRFAEPHEYEELVEKKDKPADEVYEYLKENGARSATQLAKELGRNRSQVAKVMSGLYKAKLVVLVKKVGNEKLYGLKALP